MECFNASCLINIKVEYNNKKYEFSGVSDWKGHLKNQLQHRPRFQGGWSNYGPLW